MHNTFFKPLTLILALFLLIGCGEVTHNQETPSNSTQSTAQNSNTDSDTNTNTTQPIGDSEVNAAQQANETISGTDTNSSVLSKIMGTVNTLATGSSNEASLLDISAWVIQVSNEVSELTAKNFNELMTDISPSELSSVGSNVFSNNTLLEVENDGSINSVTKNLLIMKGNCSIAYLQDSILVCTGNVDISHSTNNIIIANGDIEIAHDGSYLTGSIIYNPQKVQVSHSTKSVFIGSSHVETSHITDSDCINVTDANSSNGSCNHIQSADLTAQ